MSKQAHVSPYKKRIVKQIVDLVSEYPIIGSVDMSNLPAKQLQKIRSALRGKVELYMTKRRLMKIALKEAAAHKKGLESLIPKLEGMTCLIFTKEDPYVLAKLIKRNQSKAAIKPGQIAPNDIMVKAGPTSFGPGPVIGELGSIGLKVNIEGGKINIQKDAVVVEKGKAVPKKVADLLARLGVEPVDIGLNLVALLENGEIVPHELLFIDEQAYIDRIAEAHLMAYTLAVEVGYPTEDTIKPLLRRAHDNTYHVAITGGIVTDETVKDLLAKADRETAAVQDKIPE